MVAADASSVDKGFIVGGWRLFLTTFDVTIFVRYMPSLRTAKGLILRSCLRTHARTRFIKFQWRT